jgi:hypothetical protein
MGLMMRRDQALLWGAVLLGVASAALPKLALIALFACVVLVISQHRLRAQWPNLVTPLVGVSVVGTSIGLVRFTLTEAIPGILRGGNAAADKASLSKARQVVTAEDALRRGAFMDHDGDKIGSAGRIAELAGFAPVRGGPTMDPAPLSYDANQLLDTAIGPALQAGTHLIIVCVPEFGGGFTAAAKDPVDEERAEREYYIYAWPLATGLGVQNAYAIDQHERIWVTPNTELTSDGKSTLRYAGPSFPPPCTAVLDPNNGFTPWENKRAREHLPGDTPHPP